MIKKLSPLITCVLVFFHLQFADVNIHNTKHNVRFRWKNCLLYDGLRHIISGRPDVEYSTHPHVAVDLSVVHTFGSAVGERALRKRNEKITQAFIRGHGGWTLFHPFRVRDIWPCRPFLPSFYPLFTLFLPFLPCCYPFYPLFTLWVFCVASLTIW